MPHTLSRLFIMSPLLRFQLVARWILFFWKNEIWLTLADVKEQWQRVQYPRFKVILWHAGKWCSCFFFWDISKGFIKFSCHLDENVVLCLCLSSPSFYPSSLLAHLLSLLVSLIYVPLSVVFFKYLYRSLCLHPSVSSSVCLCDETKAEREH